MKNVGIWCEHNIQVYSAIPIVKKYSGNHNVYLFTEKKNIDFLRTLFLEDNVVFININEHVFKPAMLFKVLFNLVFVPENFSFVYKNEYVKKESKIKRILRKLFFLKISPNRLNKAYVDLNKFFFQHWYINRKYPLDILITFTKVHYAHLIPYKKGIPHINIMESWDHPMKFPYFIYPDFSLTWNKDLKNDTINIQHIKRVKKIVPLKFRYIYEYKNVEEQKLYNNLEGTKYIEELNKFEEKKVVLYPTTTSSAGIMHKGEMILIQELCEAFEKSGYYLYIKPKPNAPMGDYDEFIKFNNAIIGTYSENSNANDMLDENYHIFRYLLLKKSFAVINAGTTFGLEAALLDKNLVQLVLKNGDYLGFAKFCKTYHLKNYVLSLNGVFEFDKNKKKKLLEIINESNNTFSQNLKNWITH